MELSIIIPTCHGSNATLELLNSIQNQQNAPNYEVILVANPPNPFFRQQIQISDRLQLLETQKIGVNHARNLGLKASRGQILLFIDDDCFIRDTHFLHKHVLLHKTHQHLTALGGSYSIPATANSLAHAYHFKQTQWVKESLRPSYQADWLFGGNMSFKRANIDTYFFDEHIVFGGAETEFIWRLAATGKKIRLFPQLSIEHRAQINLKTFAKKASMQGSGAAYLQNKQKNQSEMIFSLVKKVAPPKKLRPALFFYEVCFLAGYRLQNRILTKTPILFFISCAAVLGRKILLTFYHWIFVEAWCALEGALFTTKERWRK